jgi:hypothetical protein
MERRLGGALAVRPEILFPEPHRRDLAATGPAGLGRARAALSVEPNGRGHWVAALLSTRIVAWRQRAVKFIPNALARLSTYWITSVACCKTAGGIVSPSAFAVFRLMTSSNVVACSMGRSAGFAPLRILST